MSTSNIPGPEDPQGPGIPPQWEAHPPAAVPPPVPWRPEQPEFNEQPLIGQQPVPPHQYAPQPVYPEHQRQEQQWQAQQPWPAQPQYQQQPHPQQTWQGQEPQLAQPWPEQQHYPSPSPSPNPNPSPNPYEVQHPYAHQHPAQASPYATPYAPAPHMPKGPKPKRMWILWVSIAAGLVLILTLGAVVSELGKLFSAVTTQPSISEQTSPGPYVAADGELFQRTDEHLTEMIEKYQVMSTDEIAALFPGGAAGYDESYVRDFQLLLDDLDRRLTEIGGYTVYEDANYDTEILQILSNSDELEWSFLHQEHFPLGVSVILEDGNFYESDGRYFPQGTPEFNAAREAFAMNFVPYLDGDGTYAAAGEELVAALGMKLSYDFPEMFTHCPAEGFTIQDTGGIGAAYCPAVQDTIYVNAQGNNYPNILYDPYYIDLLKHEFAHVRTTGICATSQPGVTLGEAHFEATASSYAAMFLGADRDRMAWAAADYPAYTMTAATDNAAQLIHDGTCD